MHADVQDVFCATRYIGQVRFYLKLEVCMTLHKSNEWSTKIIQYIL